jgi:hypothetical protein
MHDACCWVFEQSGAVCSKPTRRCAASKCSAWQRGNKNNDSLPVGKRHSDDDDDAHDETAQVERGVRQQGGRGNAACEPHRIWLAFLDGRRTAWFQSSATHVATLAAWPTALSPIRRC